MKRVVLASLMMVVAGGVSAQTHYESSVSVGAKGGFNMSKVFFTPRVRQTLNPGMNAGVMVKYTEENHFGLIAEVNFTQRGWRENFDELPFNYSRTMNYVQVPFLTHIYFGNRNKFIFNAGPEIGFNLGESTKSNFDYNNPTSVTDFPSSTHSTAQYQLAADKGVDFGISAGFGTELGITPKNALSLEIRCYYGLTNVVTAGRQEKFKGANTLSFSASVGYWLRLK